MQRRTQVLTPEQREEVASIADREGLVVRHSSPRVIHLSNCQEVHWIKLSGELPWAQVDRMHVTAQGATMLKITVTLDPGD